MLRRGEEAENIKKRAALSVECSDAGVYPASLERARLATDKTLLFPAWLYSVDLLI